MFSGKIVSGINVVVHTENQSVLKIHIWLSVTIFGCFGQPDNHFYEPCFLMQILVFFYFSITYLAVQRMPGLKKKSFNCILLFTFGSKNIITCSNEKKNIEDIGRLLINVIEIFYVCWAGNNIFQVGKVI